ncbi:hypothetical protein MTO96_020241 [Rhipicephalus appendiculatus]
MPKKAEGGENPPKAGRQAKRQAAPAAAAAADNGAGPSNENPPAKRPRGRPPKAVSVEPLAPEPAATTAARRLRKAADVSQPASENPTNIKAVPTKARGVSRRKRSRSSSTTTINDTASEPPKRRNARRKVSRGRSRSSSRGRHGGHARKARGPASSATQVGEEPPQNEEAQQEPPPCAVYLFVVGHEHALEARQEASPRPQSRVLQPPRKACEGEEGFESPIFNDAWEAQEGRQDHKEPEAKVEHEAGARIEALVPAARCVANPENAKNFPAIYVKLVLGPSTVL